MDKRIRERLQSLASDVPAVVSAPSSLLKRARRRAATTVMSVVVIGALVIGAGITGARALLDERSLRPANPSPGPAAKIAFNSDRNGDTEIYVMNADGSGQTNVSHGPGDITDGAWSPDGSRIAFTSDRGGNRDIYVVNADGSGLTNVSNDPCGAFLLGWYPDGLAGWSPDGSRIAFASGLTYGGGSNPPPGVGDCVSTIKVVNADGSGLTNLTNGLAAYSFGAWSPDSSRIAFASRRGGNWDVYVVNADGSGLTDLSNNPGYDSGPAWSPDSSRVSFISECKTVGGKLGLYEVNADGSGLTYLGLPPYDPIGGFSGCAPTYGVPSPSVAYASYAPDGARDALQVGLGNGKGEEIYVVNADGSGLTRLTNNLADDTMPVWSPDSSRIAWTSARSDGTTEIYVINADGSGQTRLSSGPEGDALRDGGWSPDSSRIAFVSIRDGNGEIYFVDADGSGLINLTNNPAEDGSPIWSPAG
jgi:Tol biopolymer transport system component